MQKTIFFTNNLTKFPFSILVSVIIIAFIPITYCMNERTRLTVSVPTRRTITGQCGICEGSPIPPIIILPCGHQFCASCMNRWKEQHPRTVPCPVCYTTISTSFFEQQTWAVPIFPASENYSPKRDAVIPKLNGRYCCSYKRCQESMDTTHCGTRFHLCSLCSDVYICMSCCCCCSCLDERGRVIPYVTLARCCSCQGQNPLDAISDNCYVTTEGTVCMAQLGAIVCSYLLFRH